MLELIVDLATMSGSLQPSTAGLLRQQCAPRREDGYDTTLDHRPASEPRTAAELSSSANRSRP